MENNLAKYILGFLGFIYLLSCVAEIYMVKDGTEAVFASVEKLVPHITMFMLGTLFARRE